jgi:membrane-associated phospholipid phosphatase
VATLGLGLFIMFWGLITSLALLPYGDQPLTIDQQTFDFALSLRNHLTDPIMVFLVQLGDWRVLLIGALAVECLLLVQTRYKAAAHWLVAVLGGVVLQILLSKVLSIMPGFIATPGANVPAPSAAVVLATICYGFFAVLVAPDLQRINRRWPYVAAVTAVALLAIARLYLGVDVLSTMISGFLLGGCWIMIVGIAYRQRIGKPYGAVLETSVFYLALIGAMFWTYSEVNEPSYPDFSIQVERRLTAADSWWSTDWQSVPEQRSEFGGIASQQLNSQVAGDIQGMKRALADNGWSWPLKSLNPNASHLNLPIPARNYLGRPELLHMHSGAGNNQQVETFRLWDSGWQLADESEPLYVGQLMNETLNRRLGLFSFWRGTAATNQQLSRFSTQLRQAGYEVEERDAWLLIRPANE